MSPKTPDHHQRVHIGTGGNGYVLAYKVTHWFLPWHSFLQFLLRATGFHSHCILLKALLSFDYCFFIGSSTFFGLLSRIWDSEGVTGNVGINLRLLGRCVTDSYMGPQFFQPQTLAPTLELSGSDALNETEFRMSFVYRARLGRELCSS